MVGLYECAVHLYVQSTGETMVRGQELNLRGHAPKACGWLLPYTRTRGASITRLALNARRKLSKLSHPVPVQTLVEFCDQSSIRSHEDHIWICQVHKLLIVNPILKIVLNSIGPFRALVVNMCQMAVGCI